MITKDDQLRLQVACKAARALYTNAPPEVQRRSPAAPFSARRRGQSLPVGDLSGPLSADPEHSLETVVPREDGRFEGPEDTNPPSVPGFELRPFAEAAGRGGVGCGVFPLGADIATAQH